MAKWTDDDPSGFHPESLMMTYGFRPEWSEGAASPPIFQTSTFVFPSAAVGARCFEVAYGLAEPLPDEHPDLIYSRINNPNLEMAEDRLALWDGADTAALFSSGMAAITTTLWAHLRPGDVVAASSPVYGGTHHFIETVLPQFGITPVRFDHQATADGIAGSIEDAGGRLGLIYVETPANPTNDLIDLEMCAKLAARFTTTERTVPVAVDNTFLGPLFQKPLEHGADIVVYSATKYLGGHGDLIAGAALGSHEMIDPIRGMRTFTGNMVSPFTAWLLMRSMATLQLRMERQAETARKVADYLRDHPRVKTVNYLGHLQPGDPHHDLYKRQCLGAGGMISFEVDGGKDEAYRFLDSLHLFKLAVSLGSVDSLAEHPCTMTHCEAGAEENAKKGITAALVRMSIGVEHPDDLIADIARALEAM
ncbi:MAG: methionine gamma-lyase [Actinobacteria bacterium RBG_16_68_21]|nr:MAG: methionine gamma-lyase [Actinobacteria bacterium RBG_16_68_21]